MKHIFIVNPVAGPGRVTAEQIEKELAKTGVDFEVYISKSPTDITDYVKFRGNQTPEESLRFYACGGDGSIKQVADGVMTLNNAELSVYPIGSGNDFVKYYGGKDNFLDLKKLCASESHLIDLIKVGDEYSINVTNFGFESAVAATMAKVRRKKLIGGKNAYTTGIVKALFTSMKNKGDIYVDGEKLNDGLFLLCTIANSSYVGGSYKCAPRAVTNDGYLEVCVVKPITIFQFLTLIKAYEKGTHLEDPRCANILTYRRAKQITVKSDKEFALCLDGEIKNVYGFTAEVVHNAVRFASPTYPEANIKEEEKELACK